MSSEYNNYAAGGSGWAYANLSNYNQGFNMGPMPTGKVISGKYVVPTYDAISYSALTGNIPTGSGYANIEGAYGRGAQRCQQTYTTSLCGGR